MDKHEQLAIDILSLVGGADNILNVTNCMTRMRVTLADRSVLQEEKLKQTPGVLGVVDDETYQIVLGPGAATRVTDALRQQMERERQAATAPAAVPATAMAEGSPGHRVLDPTSVGADLKAEYKRRNRTPFKDLLRKVANIFVPLIPALIACGLVAGIQGILANLVTAGNAPAFVPQILPALTAIGVAFFAFLAIFAGINAAREFGGTPVLGGAVAAIIPFVGVADIQYSVGGLTVQLEPGQGGVLGAVFAAVLLSYIERWLRGRVPEALDILVTPTVALLVSGLVTIYLIMFVAEGISTAIADLSTRLLDVSGLLAGFVLGGFFLPLVMLGLHQALIPIHATLIEQVGYTVLLPMMAMAGAGQVGAAAAIYLKLHDNDGMRTIIKGALPIGVLGVGEPLIYGVSLPLGRPFITACIGGAFGGGFIGFFAQFVNPIGATAIGPSGWALLPLVTGPGGQGYSILIYAGGLIVGYVTGFLATSMFAFTPEFLEEHNRHEEEFVVLAR